jgi:hypothetical protein
MRHGRKSGARLFNGFKASVSTDQQSEMILDIADVTASGSDGSHLLPIIERVEAQADVTVEQAIGDGAYGSGKNRAACDNYPGHAVDLVSPLARPSDPEVDKSAFQIDLEAQSATCPQGHTVTGQRAGKHDGQQMWLYTFPRVTCEACPLFERCVRSKKTGRTVRTRAYEAYLQAARLRQKTEEFDLLYRLRAAVERKIAELAHRGLRETRYVGESKRQLQRLWTGAAINLRRIFYLAESQKVDLELLLSHLPPPKIGWMAA